MNGKLLGIELSSNNILCHSNHKEKVVWSQTYILGLEHMTYHLVLTLAVLTRVRGFYTLLRVRSRHPASRHENYNVANVGNIGDGS